MSAKPKKEPAKPKIKAKPEMPLPAEKEPGMITSFINLVDLTQAVAEIEKDNGTGKKD